MEVVVAAGAIRLADRHHQPLTNQHPAFYRPDALPVAEPAVSKHRSYCSVITVNIWNICFSGYQLCVIDGCCTALPVDAVHSPVVTELLQSYWRNAVLECLRQHTNLADIVVTGIVYKVFQACRVACQFKFAIIRVKLLLLLLLLLLILLLLVGFCLTGIFFQEVAPGFIKGDSSSSSSSSSSLIKTDKLLLNIRKRNVSQ